jgi:hypothetical protein
MREMTFPDCDDPFHHDGCLACGRANRDTVQALLRERA